MENKRFEILHAESHRLGEPLSKITKRNLSYLILRDTVTNVLYLQNITHFDYPTMTPLLAPDGKPLLYSENDFKADSDS